jgi:hypothetical protein
MKHKEQVKHVQVDKKLSYLRKPCIVLTGRESQ